MKHRVVILGDSLSLPRPDDGIRYENTYGYLLQRSGLEVINRSRRTNDTSLQVNKQNILDDVLHIEPDIIIIHLGIVDCAPRLFTKSESKLLNKMPIIFRKVIIGFFSKYRYHFTKYRPTVYVKSASFKKNLEELMTLGQSIGAKIIVLNILNTNKKNRYKSCCFQDNIYEYNVILEGVSKQYNVVFIDVNQVKDGLLEDGIHINKTMHTFIFNQIKETLD